MGVVSVRCENARAAVAAIQPTSLVRWRRGLRVGDGTSSAETLDPYRSYVYRLIKSYTILGPYTHEHRHRQRSLDRGHGRYRTADQESYRRGGLAPPRATRPPPQRRWPTWRGSAGTVTWTPCGKGA